ncbi:MAG TPA: phosphatidylserine decarboxylase, partial [Bacteroidales bacterium]|nr:phosphatidylserine decarboxylase [Bacteroidales bacterium]
MRIHKEGHTIIIVNFLIWAAIAGLCSVFCKNTVVNWIVASVALFLSLFMIWFFRVPVREAVADDSLVISPGDGKVVNVKEVEETEYFGEKCLCISIFLTFFNVHVTWFPVGGIVKYYKYHPGKYIFAFHPKSSEKNERTTIAIRTDSGNELMFRQI